MIRLFARVDLGGGVILVDGRHELAALHERFGLGQQVLQPLGPDARGQRSDLQRLNTRRKLWRLPDDLAGNPRPDILSWRRPASSRHDSTWRLLRLFGLLEELKLRDEFTILRLVGLCLAQDALVVLVELLLHAGVLRALFGQRNRQA